jgi:hypothetical protein
MAKNSVSDWDTTAGNNTDVGSIPLGEGATYPSNVNNAFREIMAQIKSAFGSFLSAWTAASSSGPASLDFHEDTDNGTNRVRVTAPSSVASDKTLTLPDATDTLVGKATTDTLTNKRITPRVTTITSSATPTVNTDNTDIVNITALAAAITSMTTNLSGTPNVGDVLIFQIKDNGTGRSITWGASFTAKGVALPTTTVASKLLTVGFMWNGSNWGCVGSAQES